MTLSVLLSVYKTESPIHFDRALQSVLADQTLCPDKVVLVEDGPLTQELYDVIEKWNGIANGKMTIVINTVNEGLTKSLNRGLSYIDTDLIARMDTDDVSLPDRFRLQVDYLEKHPEVDILGGAIHEIDENDNDLCDRYYPLDDESVRQTIFRANPLAHPTVMMRRRIFEEGMRYNEKYRTNQDLALWYDCLRAGYRIANLPDIILNFRRQQSVYNRRRKKKNLWREFRIYCIGIKNLYGIFSPKYVYPVMRLCLKLLPTPIVKWAYNGRIRRSMVKPK